MTGARSHPEESLSATRPIGFAWSVALGYIATHTRILQNPLAPDAACPDVESWLAQPQVFLIQPGKPSVLFDLLRRLGTAGSLTTDAHLAALAIEHQAEICSTDADFARFPGLRWINPLAD